MLKKKRILGKNIFTKVSQKYLFTLLELSREYGPPTMVTRSVLNFNKPGKMSLSSVPMIMDVAKWLGLRGDEFKEADLVWIAVLVVKHYKGWIKIFEE